MSIMNSAEAARLALDEAAQHLKNVIVIYVEPDRTAKPLSFTKRLTLPEADDVQLPFAVGCARAGALPVLDLHALENASERFAAALRSIGADKAPPMVVRVSDRHPAAMTGARVIVPKNPRELAGALRYALRSGEICVVAENPLDAYESCEVPDDWEELYGDALETPHEDFEAALRGEDDVRDEQIAALDAGGAEPNDTGALLSAGPSLRDGEAESRDVAEPSSADEPAQNGDAARPDESAASGGDSPADDKMCEIPADDEADSAQAIDGAPIDVSEAQSAPVEPAEVRQTRPDAEPLKAPAGEAETDIAESPARPVVPAFRTRRYDPAELERTARLLNVPRETLLRLCCRCAEALAEIVIEADAEPGEIACLPPLEKAACLWVGADRLSICWDPARLDGGAARALLQDAAAYLTLPAHLILDKEN